MVINHNIPSLYASRQSKIADFESQKVMEKVSSGMRINRAADDAAGLAISEKMRSQIRGLTQASRNIADGINLIQTTEGYLNSTTAALQRIRELAIQSANGTYTSSDRMQIQVEVSQLVDEVDRIASQADFNTMTLLSGRFSAPNATKPVATEGLVIHMGANMDQRETVYIADCGAKALGLYQDNAPSRTPISLSTIELSNQAIAKLDAALHYVQRERANLGAYQNRLEVAYQAVLTGRENIQASESRIRDTDMAEKSTDLVRTNILNQAAISMLAQSNIRPALVLDLLK